MNAIFKSENKLVINGADASEILLIKNFIEEAKTKTLKATATLDINGDESGMILELVDAEANEEPSEETVDSESTGE